MGCVGGRVCACAVCAVWTWRLERSTGIVYRADAAPPGEGVLGVAASHT